MAKKLYVIFSLILILLLTVACSAQNERGKNWVIFSEAQAKELGIADWFAANGETTGYWTPAEENVLAIENGVAAFLQANSDQFRSQGAPVGKKLDDYNRQYLGITLGERKIVYANFFCASFETDWQTEFVIVMDGGACFFQFMYDAGSGEFFNLQVNGNA